MLNYIWLGLILIGITFALIVDISDISNNKYKNGEKLKVTLNHITSDNELLKAKEYNCKIFVGREELSQFYKSEFKSDLYQVAKIILIDNYSAKVQIKLDKFTPEIWYEHARAQNNNSILNGKLIFKNGINENTDAFLILDPVKFTKLNSVTNEGIVKYAKTAVELSIGLIGIMTLWLGIMKIAESSGLILKIAGLLKPITTRLFPDVPADHPAMGAMIMNISANILGLANAATPLGLKAMQELNKLNKKIGTATDAMCTFLVINTSNVQLIPATVIAIRAASGSANPTEILGPVIVATTISTVVGVVTVKLLSKLKIFRRQLEEN